MLQSEWEKLIAWQDKPISLGINETGVQRAMAGIPWNNMSIAYSMKTPNVYLAEEDIDNPVIMAELHRHMLVGCYISTPMEDYSFLKDFPHLQDLSIKNGHNLRDLSFMRGLKECRMLFLHGAKLQNMNDVIETKKEAGIRYVTCIGLHTCEIEDISSILENERLSFREFSIWTPVGRGEKERWENFKKGSRRFHIYEYTPRK